MSDYFFTEDRDIIKYNNFEELQYDGKTFDNINYFVTEVDGNTVITLREEYLKTLIDGAYLFKAVFSDVIIPIKLHVVTYKHYITETYFDFISWPGEGDAQVDFKIDTFPFVFYGELFNELQYNGKKVDASNYYYIGFGQITKFILKEKYLKTLPEGEHYFVADFKNVNVKLRLKIGIDKIISSKNVKRVKKIKVVSKNKKLIVKWKRLKNIDGYRVKIGTNKKITKNIRIVTVRKNKNRAIIKGLKAKQKYYLKIRAYKLLDEEKCWGPWSKKVYKRTK